MIEKVFDKEEWKSFLKGYSSFQDHWLDRRVQEFTSGFRHLSAGIRFVKSESLKRAKRESPDFNIFTVLGVHEREVKTHSAFLANLFDPQGTHGQGGLFLSKFLSFLKEKTPGLSVPKEAAEAEWRIQVEEPTGPMAVEETEEADGRMDLVLSSAALPLLIVIENKIYAADQHRQLQRYNCWMKRQSFYPEKNRVLIYLTLDGRDPKQKPEGISYIKMSYKEDIQRVLQRGMLNVHSPRLLDILSQYQNVISNL